MWSGSPAGISIQAVIALMDRIHPGVVQALPVADVDQQQIRPLTSQYLGRRSSDRLVADESIKRKAGVAPSSQTRSGGKRGVGASSWSKREDILAVAADHFARSGYEDTNWADIAADVGVGATALYHYFQSKLHCLFEIESDTLESFRTVFDRVTQRHERFEDGFVALLHANFDLTESEVSRCRVLVAEQGRLSLDTPRGAVVPSGGES